MTSEGLLSTLGCFTAQGSGASQNSARDLLKESEEQCAVPVKSEEVGSYHTEGEEESDTFSEEHSQASLKWGTRNIQNSKHSSSSSSSSSAATTINIAAISTDDETKEEQPRRQTTTASKLSRSASAKTTGSMTTADSSSSVLVRPTRAQLLKKERKKKDKRFVFVFSNRMLDAHEVGDYLPVKIVTFIANAEGFHCEGECSESSTRMMDTDRRDPRLTDKGVYQCKLLHISLRKAAQPRPDLMLSSSLHRSLSTMRMVCADWYDLSGTVSIKGLDCLRPQFAGKGGRESNHRSDLSLLQDQFGSHVLFPDLTMPSDVKFDRYAQTKKGESLNRFKRRIYDFLCEYLLPVDAALFDKRLIINRFRRTDVLISKQKELKERRMMREKHRLVRSITNTTIKDDGKIEELCDDKMVIRTLSEHGGRDEKLVVVTPAGASPLSDAMGATPTSTTSSMSTSVATSMAPVTSAGGSSTPEGTGLSSAASQRIQSRRPRLQILRSAPTDFRDELGAKNALSASDGGSVTPATSSLAYGVGASPSSSSFLKAPSPEVDPPVRKKSALARNFRKVLKSGRDVFGVGTRLTHSPTPKTALDGSSLSTMTADAGTAGKTPQSSPLAGQASSPSAESSTAAATTTTTVGMSGATQDSRPLSVVTSLLSDEHLIRLPPGYSGGSSDSDSTELESDEKMIEVTELSSCGEDTTKAGWLEELEDRRKIEATVSRGPQRICVVTHREYLDTMFQKLVKVTDKSLKQPWKHGDIRKVFVYVKLQLEMAAATDYQRRRGGGVSSKTAAGSSSSSSLKTGKVAEMSASTLSSPMKAELVEESMKRPSLSSMAATTVMSASVDSSSKEEKMTAAVSDEAIDSGNHSDVSRSTDNDSSEESSSSHADGVPRSVIKKHLANLLCDGDEAESGRWFSANSDLIESGFESRVKWSKKLPKHQRRFHKSQKAAPILVANDTCNSSSSTTTNSGVIGDLSLDIPPPSSLASLPGLSTIPSTRPIDSPVIMDDYHVSHHQFPSSGHASISYAQGSGSSSSSLAIAADTGAGSGSESAEYKRLTSMLKKTDSGSISKQWSQREDSSEVFMEETTHSSSSRTANHSNHRPRPPPSSSKDHSVVKRQRSRGALSFSASLSRSESEPLWRLPRRLTEELSESNLDYAALINDAANAFDRHPSLMTASAVIVAAYYGQKRQQQLRMESKRKRQLLEKQHKSESQKRLVYGAAHRIEPVLADLYAMAIPRPTASGLTGLSRPSVTTSTAPSSSSPSSSSSPLKKKKPTMSVRSSSVLTSSSSIPTRDSLSKGGSHRLDALGPSSSESIVVSDSSLSVKNNHHIKQQKKSPRLDDLGRSTKAGAKSGSSMAGLADVSKLLGKELKKQQQLTTPLSDGGLLLSGASSSSSSSSSSSLSSSKRKYQFVRSVSQKLIKGGSGGSSGSGSSGGGLAGGNPKSVNMRGMDMEGGSISAFAIPKQGRRMDRDLDSTKTDDDCAMMSDEQLFAQSENDDSSDGGSLPMNLSSSATAGAKTRKSFQNKDHPMRTVSLADPILDPLDTSLQSGSMATPVSPMVISPAITPPPRDPKRMMMGGDDSTGSLIIPTPPMDSPVCLAVTPHDPGVTPISTPMAVMSEEEEVKTEFSLEQAQPPSLPLKPARRFLDISHGSFGPFGHHHTATVTRSSDEASMSRSRTSSRRKDGSSAYDLTASNPQSSRSKTLSFSDGKPPPDIVTFSASLKGITLGQKITKNLVSMFPAAVGRKHGTGVRVSLSDDDSAGTKKGYLSSVSSGSTQSRGMMVSGFSGDLEESHQHGRRAELARFKKSRHRSTKKTRRNHESSSKTALKHSHSLSLEDDDSALYQKNCSSLTMRNHSSAPPTVSGVPD